MFMCLFEVVMKNFYYPKSQKERWRRVNGRWILFCLCTKVGVLLLLQSKWFSDIDGGKVSFQSSSFAMVMSGFQFTLDKY